MASPAEPKSCIQGCLVCLLQTMNTLADSIKSLISHVLYKAERFLILHCFISVKISPQQPQLSCLLNNLEGSVDRGSQFSFAVTSTTTLGLPSLPPFSLSPILLPFVPSMGAESCFLFWSYLSFPPLSSLRRRLGVCKTHQCLAVTLSVMCLLYMSSSERKSSSCGVPCPY